MTSSSDPIVLIGIGELDLGRAADLPRGRACLGDASAFTQAWPGPATVFAPGDPFAPIKHPWRMQVADVSWLRMKKRQGQLVHASEWGQSSTYMTWQRLAFSGGPVLLLSEGGWFTERMVWYWRGQGIRVMEL